MSKGEAMEELLTADQLVARTLYPLSRAVTVGVCPGRERALILHLERLACDRTLDPSIRSTSASLIGDWRAAEAEQFGEEAAVRLEVY